ncbi:MAG: sigma-54-dependent Fis family transcriptional regulator [Rhodocyclaceae bacterium]|nr:sigma-54-dependent Fis family transcriptional regulator [Rhodocyclaceae bacterium]
MNMTIGLPKPATVCLIEDDEAILNSCSQSLMLEGFEVRPHASAQSFLSVVRPDFPYVVITDVNLPDEDGLSLMRKVLVANPQVPVIIMTGHGDISMAVGAMREGAFDFIEKPFSPDRLITTVRNAADKAQLISQVAALSRDQSCVGQVLIGQSVRLTMLRQQISTLAPTGVDVLINGETGTGKEVVAQSLHIQSGRSGPFVAINCAALPESIIESELFGHEAGAFTGALKRRIGKFEFAKNGTIFLDEIESMPLALQAKLLRTIQDRTVQRLGANESIPISCRVIAATKRNLKTLSDQGHFRSDLYFRLNVVNLYLPPLREIREDIPLLFNFYLHQFRQKYHTPAVDTGSEVLRYLVSHDWPGNIRELRNFAERVAVGFPFAEAEATSEESPPLTLNQVLEHTEREALNSALRLASGNVADAAGILGIPAKTLYDKLTRFSIAVTDFKNA